MRRAIYLLMFLSVCAAGHVRGQDQAIEHYVPDVLPASDQAMQTLKLMGIPDGFTSELVAAEPLFANPVSFYIDRHNNFYIAETYRAGSEYGVPDNRQHGFWIDDDLAAQTVDDRRAYYLKHRPEYAQKYTRHHDLIRYVFDSDGDGKSDKSTIFADGFNDMLDGIGSSVLERDGKVYYTCIPKLWMLEDQDGDHIADHRTALHDGFGIRTAFYGHDMHGLVMGPDGKLYFSIGDRGLNVKTPEGRHFVLPNRGSVLRCDWDGSNLEVFATGLRNPQELAFDQYGNLFTGDNNSDSGDQARFVYVAEGGDSGWRMEYQYMGDRGPWNRMKIWHPQNSDQPAYIMPPVANVGSGPSGLTYVPGSSLGEDFKNSFLLCDFRGSAASSGIRRVKVKPNGAGFALVENELVIKNVLTTDTDLGRDGHLYVLDWVEGWGNPRRGRIYRVKANDGISDDEAKELKDLFAMDFHKGDPVIIGNLLSHDDMRLRLVAQGAIAAQGPEIIPSLDRTIEESDDQLVRLHSLWAMRMIGGDQARGPLVKTLKDKDEEIRAQAAKAIGECGYIEVAGALVPLLKDESARVRYFAAVSLGKLKATDAMDAVLDMARANIDEDVYLRHAAVMAIVGMDNMDAVASRADDESAAVRMVVLLAMRRTLDGRIAGFLDDKDPKLVREAAMAIHDLDMKGQLPALAAMIDREGLTDPVVLRRVLNENYRLGGREHAAALARFANRDSAPAHFRTEAMNLLNAWSSPGLRDRVINHHRPLPDRDGQVAAKAIEPVVTPLLAEAPTPVRVATLQAVGRYNLPAGEGLASLATSKDSSPDLRLAALDALAGRKSPELSETLLQAVKDDSPAVRRRAYALLATSQGAAAVALLATRLNESDASDHGAIFDALSAVPGKEADDVFMQSLTDLNKGQISPAARIELLDGASKREAPKIVAMVAAYEAKINENPEIRNALYLEGGNARNGWKVFAEKTEAQCMRCHSVDGGHSDGVGPDLSKANEKGRVHILDAILEPNKEITEGFAFTMIETDDLEQYTGRVMKEDEKELVIHVPFEDPRTIAKSAIVERRTTMSGMPSGLAEFMTRRDLRDLVQFLALPPEQKQKARR